MEPAVNAFAWQSFDFFEVSFAVFQLNADAQALDARVGERLLATPLNTEECA